MYDIGLLAACKKAVAAKPRKYLTAAQLMAVVLQESGGIPYFVDTKPGSMFRLNVSGAAKYKVITKHLDGTKTVAIIETGITEKDIRQAITIPAVVGKFTVPKLMQGQLAKFRFEPSYWIHQQNLPKLERFLYSCSWGLPQIMAPHLGEANEEGFNFIKRFMADTDVQLLYGAGMVETLLENTHGDIFRAYKGYNSGNIDSHDAAVIARAHAVATNAHQIQCYIDKREAGK